MKLRGPWRLHRVGASLIVAMELVLASALLSCGGETTAPSPAVASSIVATSGSGQAGTIGKRAPKPLAEPLRVRVSAADGRPVPGVTVTFASGNGGTFTPATATTDANGQAQAVWALGPLDKEQVATASVPGLAGSPATFVATGAPPIATKLVVTSGPDSTAAIISQAPIALVVAAQDADGDAATGFSGPVSVTLATNATAAALAGTTSVVAVNGVASFSGLSIARAASGYVLQATSGSLLPGATRAFAVQAGPAALLTLVSGGGQTADALTDLAPIVVRVTDASGNPREGVRVSFGEFGNYATGPDGQASTVWTLAYGGAEQMLTITVEGLAPLRVSATATPVHLDFVQQPDSIQIRGTVVAPVVVVALRNASNAVVTRFNGSLFASTDECSGANVNAVAGLATFAALPNCERSRTVHVFIRYGDGGVESRPFRVLPGASSRLTIIAGDSQVGQVSAVLRRAVVAKVTDKSGSPLGGVAVSFTPPSGNGSVSAPTAMTDSAGVASILWTLGPATGPQQLAVSSDGLVAVAVRATAISAAPANVRLESNNFGANRVVLDEPAPAGGTRITFDYGARGIVTVVPDTAFIPQGQLSAGIIVSILAPGVTTITPVIDGRPGVVASFSPSRPHRIQDLNSLSLGAGQYGYIGPFAADQFSQPITITSTDPGVAAVTTSSGSQRVDGIRVGSARLIASAPGYAPESVTVTVTTPSVRLAGENNLLTSQLTGSLEVYPTDSAGRNGYAARPITIALASSDPLVLTLVDSVVTMGTGAYYKIFRYAVGGVAGTAWIKATVPGHFPDSLLVTVASRTRLSFRDPDAYGEATTLRSGAGQLQSLTVNVPYALAGRSADSSIAIQLAASDSMISATEPAVIIPRGAAQSNIFVLRGGIPGTSTLTATAPGFLSASVIHVVTTPRLKLTTPDRLSAFGTGFTNVWTVDSLSARHNRVSDLAVSFRSSDTTIVSVAARGTVPAGTYYVPGSVRLTALRGGTATIYATAPGHVSDSTIVTVDAAKLNLSFHTYVIGARQAARSNEFFVAIPGSRDVPVAVTLARSGTRSVVLDTPAPLIAAGTGYASFSFQSLAPGRDTIVASAAGYLPDTAIVIVSTPQLSVSGLPSTSSVLNAPTTVVVYASDSTHVAHATTEPVTVHAFSSDARVLSAAPFLRIPAGAYYATTAVRYQGPGTATMTFSDSGGSGYRGPFIADSTGTGYRAITTNPVVVEGPAGPTLAIGGGDANAPYFVPVDLEPTLGTQQATAPVGYFVRLPVAPTTPVTVRIASSDPRVASVPSSVTVPAGSTYARFSVSSGDTVGHVLISLSAPGYAPASMRVRVIPPKFLVNFKGNGTYTISAADDSGNFHFVNADVPVRISSTAPEVATFDSAVVTIRAGAFESSAFKTRPGVYGTTNLTASDTRTVLFPYKPAVIAVSVAAPPPPAPPPTTFSASAVSLGVGQSYLAMLLLRDPTSRVTFALMHSAAAVTSSPASIETGNDAPRFSSQEALVKITGTAPGVDSITASSPSKGSARIIVTVGQGRIDPIAYWPSTLRVGDSVLVTLITRAPDQGRQVAATPTTFALSASAGITFVSGASSGAQLASVTVPAGEFSASFYVKAVSIGAATASITNSTYAPYSNSISVTQ